MELSSTFNRNMIYTLRIPFLLQETLTWPPFQKHTDHIKQREKDLSGPVDVDNQHQTGAPVTLLRIRENTTLVGLRDFARQKDDRFEHFLLTQIEEHGQVLETAISLQERNWQRITDSAAWRREFYEISEDECRRKIKSFPNERPFTLEYMS